MAKPKKPTPFDPTSKWDFWKPAPDRWHMFDINAPKPWQYQTFDDVFKQTEKRRYEKLDWCILYALGIGIEQSQLSVDHSTENWRLIASEWRAPVLVTIRTAFDGHTVAEFSDEFAAELCDQAYGDPKITTVYTTEDDERILS